MINEIVERVKRRLGDNFRVDDEKVLEEIVEDFSEKALSISHRDMLENRQSQLKILKDDIIEASIIAYGRRGTEDVTSSNDGGISKNYQNAVSYLKESIISEGKRILV